MRRRGLALLIALGTLAAACGSGDAAPASTTVSRDSTPTSNTGGVAEAPGTSAPDSSAPSTTSAPQAAPDPNRPLAPDFQLQLGTGEVYQLSAETKPVYLVFWAEW